MLLDKYSEGERQVEGDRERDRGRGREKERDRKREGGRDKEETHTVGDVILCRWFFKDVS
jgi:hypothetical protein